MLTLETNDGRTWFTPGELIEGRASWYLERDVESVEVRFFWYTSGKGSRDVGVIESLRIDRPEASGHHKFGFRAPDGPYSFSGTLITLQWAIEAVLLPGGEAERLDLLVGPRPVEVALS